MPTSPDTNNLPPDLLNTIRKLRSDIDYLQQQTKRPLTQTPIVYEIAWGLPGAPYTITFPAVPTPVNCSAYEMVVTSRVADTAAIAWRLLRSGNVIYSTTLPAGSTFYKYTSSSASFPANTYYSESDQSTWSVEITSSGNGIAADLGFILRFI